MSVQAPDARQPGVVFCATGPKFRRECHRAIRSLRAFHPDILIEVHTDEVDEFPGIGRRLPEPSYDFRDKIAAFARVGFERFLFLDTDVTVVGELGDLFALLARFDVLAVPAPVALNAPRIEVTYAPAAFPQFHSGVLAMRFDSDFVARWRGNWHWVHRELAEDPHYAGVAGFDQISLRKTLFEDTGLRLFSLPSGYNIRPFGPFAGPPKIIHDRYFQAQSADRQAALLGMLGASGPSAANSGLYMRNRKRAARLMLDGVRCLVRHRVLFARVF